jgi:hypothetical protein
VRPLHLSTSSCCTDVAGLFFLVHRCLHNADNVLAEFVAAIGLGCLICTFEVVLASSAATVLLVDYLVPDKSFEVYFCFVEVVLGSIGFVFPLCHLFLVKVVKAYNCLR